MFKTEEAQVLLAIVDTRNVNLELVSDSHLDAIKTLEEKGMVDIVDNVVNASPQGVTLVKIFKSGLNFETIFKRLNFKSITKLMHAGIDKCLNDGIHLNVIFKNMPQEHLERIKKEIEIAEQARSVSA